MAEKRPKDLVLLSMLDEISPDRYQAIVAYCRKRDLRANPEEVEPYEVLGACGHHHFSDSNAIQNCMRQLERKHMTDGVVVWNRNRRAVRSEKE